MKIGDLAKHLDLTARTSHGRLDRSVQGGYVSDLLSDVMAHAEKDGLWVTIQVHPNIVAVAVLKELAAIVIANGREPAEETLERGEQEGVAIFTTPLSAFELVGRLYELGIKGT